VTGNINHYFLVVAVAHVKICFIGDIIKFEMVLFVDWIWMHCT